MIAQECGRLSFIETLSRIRKYLRGVQSADGTAGAVVVGVLGPFVVGRHVVVFRVVPAGRGTHRQPLLIKHSIILINKKQ